MVKYLREVEAIFEKTLSRVSGELLNDKKNLEVENIFSESQRFKNVRRWNTVPFKLKIKYNFGI
jgi:hypothetical protein